MVFFKNFPSLLSSLINMPFLQLLLFWAITRRPSSCSHGDLLTPAFMTKIPPEKKCTFVPILIPIWKPVFLLFTIKFLAVLCKKGEWGTVFRALACCDPPLPGKAIKLFFFFPYSKPSLCISIWHWQTEAKFQQHYHHQKQTNKKLDCLILFSNRRSGKMGQKYQKKANS